MIIIATTIVAIALIITNTNPIVLARDAFAVFKSQASAIEINKEGQVLGTTTAVIETAEADAKNNQVEEKKPREPVKKTEIPEAPEITARSALVIDAESSRELYAKNPDEQLSIASITKLMTALVALEKGTDLTQEYVMREEDRRNGGRIYLFLGDKVMIKDLLNASLVGSGNTETIALVHALGESEDNFVALMNVKAKGLGLPKTTFVDPIGLSSNNKSTAREVAKIVTAALSRPEIREAVSKQKYTLRTKQGRAQTIENTDGLLKDKLAYHVAGGKTGYLESAGFCFAGEFYQDGHEIISVVLGSSGVDTRFSDTDALVTWAYRNYVWP